MLDILFIGLFLGIPFIVINIMHKIDLKFFTISIPSFLIISIFVFAYIGTLPLYFAWDEFRFNAGVQDKKLIFQVFIFSSLTIFGLLGGFAFSKYILKMQNIGPTSKLRVIEKIEFLFLITLMIFSFCILVLYLLRVESIALISLIFENSKEAAISRSLMTNDFSGKYHWYSLGMHHVMIIVTFIFFSAWLISKEKSIFILFLLSFIGSSFVALMTTEKAPFAWLIIGLFLTYYLTNFEGKMPIKNIIILFVSTIIVLTIFYMLIGNNIYLVENYYDIVATLKMVFSRTFAGSIQPAYHYLEFFPHHQEFLMGRSFPNPGGIFSFEPYRMTVEVMNWKYPEHLTLGIVGSMPTVFWAEAYANFGYYGIIIIPFLVGIVIWIISFLVNKIENTPIKIGLLVWIILHYKDLSITGFSGYLVDFYFICIIFIFLILFLLIYKLKKFKEKV